MKTLARQPICADQRVNTGRQLELDLLKAVAVIVMILAHCNSELVVYEGDLDATISDYLAQLLNASVFMMSMGMSCHYSRHNSAKAFALRGFGILTVGQLLELTRDVLPNLIGYCLTKNQFFFCQMALVFSVDIMQLAGLSFLLIALFKRLNLKPRDVFLISWVLSLAGSFLMGVNTGNYLVDQILGFFYATSTESFFPLFSWFIFVAFGYYFGDIYQFVQDKKRLFRYVFLIGVPLCLIYYSLRYLVPVPGFSDMTELVSLICPNLLDALMFIVLALVELGLMYEVSRLFKGKAPGFVTYPAKQINKYYCVSWVLIDFTAMFLRVKYGQVMTDVDLALLVAIALIAACTVLILLYEKYLEKYIKRMQLKKKLVAFALIWVISIAVAAWVFPRAEHYPNWGNDYLLSEDYHYFD